MGTCVVSHVYTDEMGLGKTVELLGCILGHPKPHKEEEEVLLCVMTVLLHVC